MRSALRMSMAPGRRRILTGGQIMNLKDCVDFAKQNPFCSVATMDAEQPRVRTLQLDWADESGFYFASMTPKDLSKQLRRNPRVEVCFFNHAGNLMEVRQMRLTGRVEFITDAAAVQRANQLRAPLAPMIKQSVGVVMETTTDVFRIAHGEAHFWMIPDILKEHQLERVRF
jgi:pyridoxamine 5'-phosphate oxidase